MAKTATFWWGWNDYPAQRDKLMTRDRAAKLLRVWRRQSRTCANYRTVVECKRQSRGVYKIVSQHGESGRMIVGERKC